MDFDTPLLFMVAGVLKLKANVQPSTQSAFYNIKKSSECDVLSIILHF